MLAAGTHLEPDIVLEALVASGGQGEVWQARRNGAVVALKIVQRGPRLGAEVDQLRRMSHPSVVRALDLVDVDAGRAGIVLPWIEGRPLGDAARDPRWTPDLAARALRHLLHALVYVHARGVVHRDVKPANVLVTEAFLASPDDPSTVVLVDFGIAAPIDNPTPVTELGSRVGTAPYLAPEVFLDPLVRVEPSRDVFALGVVGWELLANDHPLGRPPPGAEPWVWYATEYRRALDGQRPFPEGQIAGPLDAQLRACLRLSPRDRPRDANHVLDLTSTAPALATPTPSASRGGATTMDVPTPLPTAAAAPLPRRRGRVAAVIVAVLAAAGLAVALRAVMRRNPCEGVPGVTVDPPRAEDTMNLRTAPDANDAAAILRALPSGTIVESLDRMSVVVKGEDWYRVRVVCSPDAGAQGLVGYIHGIGLPGLLQKRRIVRPTEIGRGDVKRKLPVGTSVGVMTTTKSPQKYVRVLEGPDRGFSGWVPSDDIEP